MGGASISSATAGATVAINAESVTITLPAPVVSMLEREAKARKKSIAAFMAQWLEDQADARESAAMLKRIEAGKEPTTTWREMRKRVAKAA